MNDTFIKERSIIKQPINKTLRQGGQNMNFNRPSAAFLAAVFVLISGFLHAMLPGHIYQGRIAGSAIQAIAVVKAIEEITPGKENRAPDAAQLPRPKLMAPTYRSKTYSSKQAVFVIEKLIKLKSLSDDDANAPIPAAPIQDDQVSANDADSGSKPLELSEGSEVIGIFHVPIVQTTDDPLFFSPQAGERVFVTISSAGGEITSYTILDSDLENALLSNPETVGIGIGNVFRR